MKQTATITQRETGNVNSKAHRKDKNFYGQYTLVAIDSATKMPRLIELARLRLYATQAQHTACFWLNKRTGLLDKEGHHLGGSDKASGCGYHRASAAAEGAMAKAGILLSDPIGGRGDGAIKEALLAIGAALGFDNVQVLEAFA